MAARKVVLDVTRALKFFEKTGYMTIKEGNALSPRAFIFGQTGGLLVHNFMSEWFSSNVILRDAISIVQPSLYEKSNETSGFHLRRSLSDACQEFYKESVLLHDSKLPFGLVTSGRCLDINNRDGRILNVEGPQEFTECLLQYYIPEGLVTETFHRFEVDKLVWWKMLSNSKELTALRSDDGKTSSISYSSSHGSSVVETLRVCGPCHSLPQEPFMVEARVIVDTAALVFLCDAYSESHTKSGLQVKSLGSVPSTGNADLSSGDDREVPVSDSQSCNELDAIAEYITRELKKEEILIKSTAGNSNITSLQQLGIPYLVILSETTLEDGMVLFHNLKESTKESIHLTELRDKVVRYINY